MTNYPQLQESINRLSELLTKVKEKDAQIQVAILFNNSNTFPELHISIPKIRKELKALKKEYRDLTLKLKLK